MHLLLLKMMYISCASLTQQKLLFIVKIENLTCGGERFSLTSRGLSQWKGLESQSGRQVTLKKRLWLFYLKSLGKNVKYSRQNLQWSFCLVKAWIKCLQGSDHCFPRDQSLIPGPQVGPSVMYKHCPFKQRPCFSPQMLSCKGCPVEQVAESQVCQKQGWEVQTSRFYLFTIPHGRLLSQHPFPPLHSTRGNFFAASGKKKFQPKHSEPCTWSLCAPLLNVILIVCRAFKFAFCRNISTWPSYSLSELPQSRGARARYAAPFCQRGSFVFFYYCMPRTAIQPRGVVGGWRSLDYDHYLVNKMSTRCFLDTLLSKRRKVQKWTPPSQWAP